MSEFQRHLVKDIHLASEYPLGKAVLTVAREALSHGQANFPLAEFIAEDMVAVKAEISLIFEESGNVGQNSKYFYRNVGAAINVLIDSNPEFAGRVFTELRQVRYEKAKHPESILNSLVFHKASKKITAHTITTAYREGYPPSENWWEV